MVLKVCSNAQIPILCDIDWILILPYETRTPSLLVFILFGSKILLTESTTTLQIKEKNDGWVGCFRKSLPSD